MLALIAASDERSHMPHALHGSGFYVIETDENPAGNMGKDSTGLEHFVPGKAFSVWPGDGNDHGRASRIRLKGPWVAQRTLEKPAPDTISVILACPACAPRPSPTS
jgi:hypothetical protein